MNFNWKIIVLGGLAMYVAQFIVSFATGPLIHEGVLDSAYRATASFWRPELNQDPPDMAALMPRWITVGVIGSMLLALVYGWVRSAFTGAGWVRGLKFGLAVWIVQSTYGAGWSGVFNLPEVIWAWWIGEAIIYNLVGGAVLGLVAEKVAPEAA